MAFIKALIFDLDNTLFDRDAVAQDVLRAMGLNAHMMAKLLEADAGGMSDRLSFARHAVQIGGLDRSAEAFWGEFRDRVAESTPHDAELRAMLVRLSQKYRLGVLSNGGSSNQRRKIRNLGIEDLLQALVVCGEHTFQKPDPQAFHYACDLLKVHPQESLMIGNDYEADFLGAEAAGLQSLLVGTAANATLAHVKHVEEWLSTQVVNSAS